MTLAELQRIAPNASKATREANGFFCEAGDRCDVTGRPPATMVLPCPMFTLEAEPSTLRTTDTSPLSFFLDCIPPTATDQQKGAFIIPPKKGESGKGTIQFFVKKEVRAAQAILEALLRPHAPAAPREGPIRLSVTFAWPWRASEPKGSRHGVRWKDTQPDSSNLIKGLEDCMTRLGFWRNDGQIADLRVAKGWSDKPGIEIVIESLDSHAQGDRGEGRSVQSSPK